MGLCGASLSELPSRVNGHEWRSIPQRKPIMDEIVKDFLIESAENLDRFDQELVKLECDPESDELLASMFRTIHTIRGSAGFLGFARLQKVAHAGENLLSRLRDRHLSLTAQMKSGLLAMVGAVRRMLSEIGRTERDGDNDYSELLEILARMQGSEANLPSNAGMGEKSAEEMPSDFATSPPTAQSLLISAKINARRI
jgi:two-component system, chemotaxis family, sensor kinase CheA